MQRKLAPLAFLIFAVVLFAISILVGSVRKTERTAMACTTQNFSGNFEEGAPLAEYYGNEVQVPAKSSLVSAMPVLGSQADGERYIEIDLSEQKLRAWGEIHFFWKLRFLPVFPGFRPRKENLGYGQNFAIRGWREEKEDITTIYQMFRLLCISKMILFPAIEATAFTAPIGIMILAESIPMVV